MSIKSFYFILSLIKPEHYETREENQRNAKKHHFRRATEMSASKRNCQCCLTAVHSECGNDEQT